MTTISEEHPAQTQLEEYAAEIVRFAMENPEHGEFYRHVYTTLITVWAQGQANGAGLAPHVKSVLESMHKGDKQHTEEDA